MKDQITIKHLKVGAYLCALYVVLGAFGAHGLENKLTVSQLATYHTGLRYLIVHSLALILTNFTYQQWQTKKIYSNYFFYGGIVLFSFSLLVHACKDLLGIQVNVFAMLAPLGGLSYVAGWIMYALTIGKK